jgi:hypothetical protein
VNNCDRYCEGILDLEFSCDLLMEDCDCEMLLQDGDDWEWLCCERLETEGSEC